MTKIYKLFIVTIVGFLVIGCTSPKKYLYNYGNYSQSYYNLKKYQTDEAGLELQKAMEKTIAESKNSLSKRVPPGMYANLGYLYLKAGKSSEAIESFTKEKTTYPEATHFMDRMIKKVEVTEGKNNE